MEPFTPTPGQTPSPAPAPAAPPSTRRHRDRGWIHALPVVLALFSWIVGPLLLGAAVFIPANADVDTRPAAGYVAAVAWFVGIFGLTFISLFITAVGYRLARPARDSSTRTMQIVSLVTSGVLALVGVVIVGWTFTLV